MHIASHVDVYSATTALFASREEKSFFFCLGSLATAASTISSSSKFFFLFHIQTSVDSPSACVRVVKREDDGSCRHLEDGSRILPQRKKKGERNIEEKREFFKKEKERNPLFASIKENVIFLQ